MIKKLPIQIYTLILVLVLSIFNIGNIQAQEDQNFDVGVGAFVDIDDTSTIEITPTSNEVGIYSDVTVRILDRSGNPLVNHSVQLYIDGDSSGISFVQPPVTDSDGYATGKVRSTNTGVYVVKAYDTTYSQNIDIQDSESFYVFPVQIPSLEPEPSYTKGNENKLYWEHITGVSTYEYLLQVSTTSTFSTIYKSSEWVNSTAYEFSELEGGQIYFYRIKARNESLSESSWSNYQFSVQDDQAPIITLISIAWTGNSVTDGISIELTITDDLELETYKIYCVRSNGDLEECGSVTKSGTKYSVHIPYSQLEKGVLSNLENEYSFCVEAWDKAGNMGENCNISISLEKFIETPIPDITIIVNSILERLNSILSDLEDYITSVFSSIKGVVIQVVSIVLFLLFSVISLTLLTGSLLLIPSLLLDGFLKAVQYIGFRKHGKKVGMVYDSITKKPIRYAKVLIYDSRNRLVRTSISDSHGEFKADLDTGKYRVIVQRSGYIFPSNLIKPREDLSMGNVYKGEYIITSQRNEMNIVVPIDQINFQNNQSLVGKSRVIDLLKALNFLIVAVGLSLSIFLLEQSPNILNFVLVLIYIPIIGVFLKSVIRWKFGMK